MLGRICCEQCRLPCWRRWRTRRVIVCVAACLILLVFSSEVMRENGQLHVILPPPLSGSLNQWSKGYHGAAHNQRGVAHEGLGLEGDKFDSVDQGARLVAGKFEEDQMKAVNTIFMVPGQHGPKAGANLAESHDQSRDLSNVQGNAPKQPITVKTSVRVVTPARLKDPVQPAYVFNKHEETNIHRAEYQSAPKPTVGVGVDPVALLILRPQPFFSISLADMREVLAKHRIRFENGLGSPKSKTFFPQPAVNSQTKLARYSVIIFEDWALYTLATKEKQKQLDAYCLKYGVGVVAFVDPAAQKSILNGRISIHRLPRPFVDMSPVLATSSEVVELSVNSKSPVLRIMKDGGKVKAMATEEWCSFQGNFSSFVPLEFASSRSSASKNVISMSDSGRVDAIKRVLFCHPSAMYHWIHKALFLDAVSYVSPAMLGLTLARRFLMDIDDIFVAPLGTKMSPEDVEVRA